MKTYKGFCVFIAVGLILAFLYGWVVLILCMLNNNKRQEALVIIFIPIAVLIYSGLLHPLLRGKKIES